MQVPAELYGPLGLLVALSIAVGWLWREHLKSDEEDRRQRDEALALARDAVEGTKRMAAAWEARNRRDEQRDRAR
jgi:hypothetical protein